MTGPCTVVTQQAAVSWPGVIITFLPDEAPIMPSGVQAAQRRKEAVSWDSRKPDS